MFDLFRSRERSVRYILAALLLLVAASLVITLVPGYGTGWAGPADPNVLAEVGDHRITVQDVRKIIQREVKGSIPEGMASTYVSSVVQQLVAFRASALFAETLGLRITDEEVARIVRELNPQLWSGGTFAGKEAYAQVIASLNMTIPEYEDAVRAQALQARLDILALEGAVVTPQEIEQEYRRRHEAVKLAVVGVYPGAVRSRVTLADADLRAYYEKNKATFRIPEKRSYVIFVIDENQIASSIQVPDEQLRQIYAQQQSRFRTEERVRARHILIKTIGRPESEVPALQKKAEELLQKLKSGADFGELARKHSEDPGSAAKGGELDWIIRGQTVPEFEQAAFSLKPRELSGIIKTQYGFHIIQVLAHEEARLRPFEEVRSELAAEARRAQVYDRMQRLADQIRSALVRSREDAEQIARANGVRVIRAENLEQSAPVPEIGVNEQFRIAVRDLPLNGISPVTQIADNQLAVIQVTAIQPPRQGSFEEALSSIRGAAAGERAIELSRQIAAQLEARVKAGVTDPDQLAREFGLKVETTDFITRLDNITGIGFASAAEEAFRSEPGAFVGPIRASGGVFFARVLDKRPADMTGLAKERPGILQELKGQRARERSEMVRAGIVEELARRKKIKIYEENIKRLAAAYDRT